MRWLLVTAVAVACATPNEISYTTTYSSIGPFMVVRLALEATAGQGYLVVEQQQRFHDFVFLTQPERLTPQDAVDVAFLVQITYETQATSKNRFTVLVVPRAYVNDRQASEERLPPSWKPRARQLSDAIRKHSQRYEAPI